MTVSGSPEPDRLTFMESEGKMTTIEVTTDTVTGVNRGEKFNALRTEPSAYNPNGAWRVTLGPLEAFVFFDDEVIALPSARHRSFYDKDHPGELEPDAYDRMSYKYDDHGRHLLHTGSE
jgi:hypothetical protein